MASRSDTDQRKRALVGDVVAAIGRGELAPGDQLPPLSTLTKRYDLSKPTVLKVLQPLITDGTLRSVTAVGIFVASGKVSRQGCHLFLVQSTRLGKRHGVPSRMAARAFEERISWHGGSALVLGTDAFLDPDVRRRLPPVVGAFSLTGGHLDEILALVDPDVPVVSYLAGAEPPQGPTDSRLSYVDVDNVSGGRLATGELARNGHRDVVFLGLHTEGTPYFPWSRQRAIGWRQAMHRHNPRAELLCLQPDRPPRREALTLRERGAQSVRAAESVARVAVDRIPEGAACVGADDTVIAALVARLQERRVPVERWPAMVGFEGLSLVEQYVISSVRPRWDDLGMIAADRLVAVSRGRGGTTSPWVGLAPMVPISRPVLMGSPHWESLAAGE